MHDIDHSPFTMAKRVYHILKEANIYNNALHKPFAFSRSLRSKILDFPIGRQGPFRTTLAAFQRQRNYADQEENQLAIKTFTVEMIYST
uniref:PDEase domain-containing protein n=1 Tax=Steinernema glaseri TaxID=37863 RepID=A0A1I7ZUU8_9BILA